MSLSSALLRENVPLKGLRILVVEDEYFLANDIECALRSLGAEIIGPIGDLAEALAILNRGNIPDGAVLDMNIGGQMAFPIGRELHAHGVPFMFASGYDKSSLGAEFQDVLLWEKPIDVLAMARGLAELIQSRQA